MSLEDYRYISISDFSKAGIVKENRKATFTIKGAQTIYNLVSSVNEEPYYFDISTSQTKQRIFLESIPSNLGKGRLFYFVCPISNKRCRKLFLSGSQFVSGAYLRSLGVIYESQCYSKYQRNSERLADFIFRDDEFDQATKKKHFKRSYNGKLTKAFIKAKQKWNRNNLDF